MYKRYFLKSNYLILTTNHCHLGISFETENLFYNFIILKYILRHYFSSYDAFKEELLEIPGDLNFVVQNMIIFQRAIA